MQPEQQLHDTVTGEKGAVLRLSTGAVALTVVSVTFRGSLKLHRARARPQESGPEASIEELIAGPHWTRDARLEAAYIRAASSENAIELEVMLEASPGFSGSWWLKATSNHATLGVPSTKVHFEGGKATAVLKLEGVPQVVCALESLVLEWRCADTEHGRYGLFQETSHTLFFILAQPRTSYGFKLYVDTLRWTCAWATGASSEQAAFDCIWGQFAPVQAEHPTRLQYWVGSPLANTLASIMEYRVLGRRGVNCVGLAQLLMGCVAAHGMASVQVTLKDDGAEPNVDSHKRRYFDYQGRRFAPPTTWACVPTSALGNPAPGSGVGSHSVAIVQVEGQWRLCDPSYGLGPYRITPENPRTSSHMPLPFEFVQALVRDFSCVELLQDGLRGEVTRLVPREDERFPELYGHCVNALP